MCGGFQQHQHQHQHLHQDRLFNIKAFYIRLSTNPKSPNPQRLPDSLTLCYLPRINGSPLEINSSKIRPHSPAFVTLHRLMSPPTGVMSNINMKKGGFVYFGSRERVKASHGARFEVYLREHKVLKGIFRKDWDDRWKMGCSCGLDDDDDGVLQLVKEAEVCVAAQGQDVAMREKVEMVVKRRRRSRSRSRWASCRVLEEIPEETEFELDDDSCCSCSSDDDEEEMGSSSNFDEEEEEGERDTGVSWAVDVGIWVVCLGVGFLVSSNAFLRRRKTTKPFF